MANANPSSPGRAQTETAGRIEINVPKDVKIVRKTDGRIVRRTEMQTGTIRETEVFEGDFEDADVVNEADLNKTTKEKK